VEANSSREEFLAERKRGIGASDCASLLNAGYGCQRRLWYDKSNVPPDYDHSQEQEDYFELGRALEPLVRSKYARITRRAVHYDNKLSVHPEIPYVIAHLDGEIADAARGLGVLELKAVGRDVFWKAKREGLPVDYILQNQHGQLARQLTWGAFGLYCRDNGQMECFDVAADSIIHEIILEAAADFWPRVGKPELAPAPLDDPDDSRCQRCAWRSTCRGAEFDGVVIRQKGEDIPPDETLRPLRDEFLERQELKRLAEDLLDETKEEIKTRMGDRTAVSVAGKPIYYRLNKPRMFHDVDGLADYAARLRAELIQIKMPTPEQAAAYPEVTTFLNAKQGAPVRPLRVY